MRIYLLIGLLLVGCGKPDYSKPHEYIRAIGYGENWGRTEGNEYKFRLSKKNITSYFEAGLGECEKYLSELDAEKVYMQMAATNLLMHSEPEGKNDIPIKYAKLQCVAFQGVDHGCEEKRVQRAVNIAKSVGRQEADMYVLRSWAECRMNKELGSPRLFSLEDSKKFKYVP